MPKFHFHTEDGQHHPDPDGLELTDSAAARAEAIRALGQLVAERHEEFWQDGAFRMLVTDGSGLTLIVLDLVATVSPSMHHYR
ncbi:MAG: DUF6894 family protein [Phenylobacterium sp.]